MGKCLYVIAAWFGPRRYQDSRAAADPLFYVRTHLRALERISCRSEVVIAINGDPPPEAESLLSRHAFFTRPNEGMSYGAWSDACERYPEFDYYALAEDDYIPLADPFRELIPIMQREAIGCLGGLVSSAGYPTHMAVANCVISREAVEAIQRTVGKLSVNKDAGYADHTQVEFSQNMIKGGVVLRDYTEWFQTPYFNGTTVIVFGNREHAPIWVPVQRLVANSNTTVV